MASPSKAARAAAVLSVLGALVAFSACDASSANLSSADNAAGSLTESCHSSNPSHHCIGVKYVVYQRENGQPVASEDTVFNNIAEINRIWKECDIAFQVEKLEVVDPTAKGLVHGSGAASQTEAIRRAYSESDTFLIATTEEWNTTKNAWTNPPGSSTYGVVLEASVADYPSIIAHELGHYLSLDHVDGPSNALMYYSIVRNPAPITAGECQQARASVERDWARMRR